MLKLIAMAALGIGAWYWFSEPSLSYSEFKQSYLDTAEYNTLFVYPKEYRPNGKESEFIGQAKGLKDCAYQANNKLSWIQGTQRLTRVTDWGYACLGQGFGVL